MLFIAEVVRSQSMGKKNPAFQRDIKVPKIL